MKKTAFFLFVVLVSVCLLTVSAASEMTFLVGSAVGAPGSAVTVPVTLKGNPGFVSANLLLEYDASVLTLTAVEDAGVLEGAMHSDVYASPYHLTWNNDLTGENSTAEGTLVLLTFAVNENAPAGDCSLRLSAMKYGILDSGAKAVDCSFENGVIRVGTPGDVNGDSAFTAMDLQHLWQHTRKSAPMVNGFAGDLDCSGITDAADERTMFDRLMDRQEVDGE